MSRFRGTSISAFLTVAVLALGACGGDDEGGQDSANTGTETAATTGTTETGTTNDGASETGTTERERTERTETQKRKRKSSGGSDDSSGSGGGGNSGSGGGGNSGSNAEKQLTGKNVESTSKTVCSQFLPTALAKDLQDGDKSAEEIAKEYSAGYPAAERKRAYDGCLAGLKTRD